MLIWGYLGKEMPYLIYASFGTGEIFQAIRSYCELSIGA